MLHKTKGIVLHHFKYTDSSVIANIYTQDFGKQSYIITNARNKKSNTKAKLLQPLYLLDLEIFHKQNRELQRINEFKIIYPFKTIPYNIIKSSIAIFLGEIINKSVRSQDTDNNIFNFLFNSIQFLDSESRGSQNFHLIFLTKFTKFLGFAPKDSLEKPKYFDLSEGTFTCVRPFHDNYLYPELSNYFRKFINCSFDELSDIRINNTERQKLLEKIIQYYQFHLLSLNEIKSLKVFNSVFNSN